MVLKFTCEIECISEAALGFQVTNREKQGLYTVRRTVIGDHPYQNCLLIHTRVEVSSGGAGETEDVCPVRTLLEIGGWHNNGQAWIQRGFSRERIENALNRFIGEPSETWAEAFSATQPVFQGGALRSNLRLARANWQEAVLAYQQTIQSALQQVSNALIASQKNREFREQQRLLTQAAKRSDDLSQVLYQHGGASYLQVLTNETNYFSAELNLVQAQLNERLALVQLYQALGGGWLQ